MTYLVNRCLEHWREIPNTYGAAEIYSGPGYGYKRLLNHGVELHIFWLQFSRVY